MAIKKITFTNANVTAQNDADLYYFLQGGTGILKGIKNEIKASNNANRFIFEDGYVSIYGRLLFVDNNTDITVPLNRTAMGYVVLDINTATNSAELTYTEATNGGYPVLIQENLSTGAGRYQFPLAAYSKTGAALTPDQSFKPAYLYPHMERQQGASNAGKVLAVGTDGYIILMNQSGINAGQLEGHPASYFQEKQAGKGLSTNDYDDTEKEAVAANTAARHSHSNKAVLDGITQEIVNKANSLKYDAEGKLSPDLIPSAGINVKSADTAYKDEAGRNIKGTFDKGLYNLGAFDTVTDNEDGTATITRKTGYATFDGSSDENWQGWDGDNYRIKVPGAKNTGESVVHSNRYQSEVNWSKQKNIAIFAVGDYNLFIRDNSYNLQSFVESLRINPLKVQYELASSYTEKVIKNERNNHVDDFSRGQWEKGINLFNKNDIIRGCGLNGQGGVDYQYTNYFVPNFIPVKPNTTYTYSGATSSFDFYDINKNFIYMRGQYGTFTTPDNCYFVRFNALLTLLDSLMLNEGNQAVPYQPFDYSGHIQNEQGRYLIEHEEDARNLFNVYGDIKAINNDLRQYFSISNNGITVNNNLTGNSHYLTFSKIYPKGTYTIKLKVDTTLQSPAFNTRWRFLISTPVSNGVFLDYYDNCYFVDDLTDKWTFTANEDFYIGFVFMGEGQQTKTYSNIMLVEGPEAKPHTPYNSKEHITNNQATLLGFEASKTNLANPKATFNVNELTCSDDNVISIPGGLSVSWYGSQSVKPQTYIMKMELDPGVYTMRLYSSVTSGATGRIQINDSAEQSDIGKLYVNTTIPGARGIFSEKSTFTVDEKKPLYFRYCMDVDYNGQKGVSSSIAHSFRIQLNPGTEEQQYVPYTGQIARMKDLQLYGEMPELTDIGLNETNYENMTKASTYVYTTQGKEVNALSCKYSSDGYGYIDIYPVNALKSIASIEITYEAGDNGYLVPRANLRSSTLAQIEVVMIAAADYIYTYGSTSSRTARNTTFKLTVKDVYGNVVIKRLKAWYKS